MGKPRAVQKAVAAAEQLHQEAYEADTPEAEDLGAEAPQDAPEPAGETDQVRADDTPANADEVEPAPGTEAWEQKYRTLDGKYKSEVPRLHDENDALRQEVSNMQQILANFGQDGAREVEVTPGEPLLRPEEVEDYGEDLISVVKRAAREEISPELSRLEAENRQLRDSLSSVSSTMAESARGTVYRQLDTAVPDWKELNKSQHFLDWLSKRDVYSGLTRQDLLSKAFEANDAARVIAFFRGYKQEQTVVTDGAQQQEDQPLAGSPLETLVAPGRPSATGAAGATPQGRIWTQAEIAAFYSDVNKGRFKGREKEKSALEQDIVNASVEGRIR
jgi:hypothetical protein